MIIPTVLGRGVGVGGENEDLMVNALTFSGSLPFPVESS
jgi:hypothetical protein